MLLLVATLAQAATIRVSVHDGSEDKEARVVTTVHRHTDAPFTWTTAAGRERQMLVDAHDVGEWTFVTIRVRERGDAGWELVAQPTLMVGGAEPARFSIGTQRPVVTEEASTSKHSGRRARTMRFQDVMELDLSIELLEAEAGITSGDLHLSAFREQIGKTASAWVPATDGLECPEGVQVEQTNGATRITVPLSAVAATWTCALRGEAGSVEDLSLHLQIW